LIDVAGAPRGSGNPEAMAQAPAARDAPVVQALRTAGADVFASASLLEYAAGATHPLVPEALNPYDVSRTAGGSSGGSAALVGAGVCGVAVGTDTGGSIRIPAHYCGIVGFKPSFGAIDVGGVQPLAPSLDHVGLLARDVATTARVFAAITGHRDEGRRGPVGGAPRPLRAGLLLGQLADPAIQPDVRAALEAATDALRSSASSEVVEVNGGALAEMDRCFDDIILFEAWQVHRHQVERAPSHYGPETLRLLQGASRVSRADYDAAVLRRDQLRQATTATYDGVDVLISPAAPFVAPVTTPPIDTPEGEAEAMFTRVYNLTGAPAIVLPCGWNDRGLPIGIQLSSPPGRDMELLGAAAHVEEILAVGRRPPALS
jgi:Asp-tRNA(Asn)/Glu-tRNA(Gln) amidotransferase A subunit family amidase